MMKKKHIILPALCLMLAFIKDVGCRAQSNNEIHKTVEKLSEALIENYIFEDKAISMATLLNDNLTSGKYDAAESFEELANMLHQDLREIVPDKHLRVRYGPRKPSSSSESEREYFEYGIAETKILEGNIGYFDLRGFSNNSKGLRSSVAEAMTKLEGSTAIIFDMRKNGGGSPSGVQLFCSYFFPEGKEILLNSLYFRNRDVKNDFYTFDQLDGPRFPDTPLYILTSNYTFSGGEEFCYNMQTQNRATLIGETTGGGAHPVGGFQIGHDITAVIPIGRAINPITGTNWEAVGVIPDIEVSSEEALNNALRIIKGK